MTAYERMHGLVEGVVQGVGFRYHTMKTATALGLFGWVRNLPDGRVEFYAEGAAGPLDDLLKWIHRGPENARVASVNLHVRETIPQCTLHRFEIR